MISGQRLVRKLCLNCRVAYKPSAEILGTLELTTDEKTMFYKPGGCDQCRSSGYKGRTVITELIEMKPAILDLIMKGGSNDDLRKLAVEMGMQTLRLNGICKAKEGATSVEEVLRVTSPEMGVKT
jgi:type II secretory ATPase GspE/PulE/Tfp pilus assembly ATPase PilB-like protein